MQYNFTSEEYLNIARALISQQNTKAAFPFLEKCLAIDSRNEDAWLQKGICLDASGNYSSAIECFDIAISLLPQYADAYYYKGEANAALKQYDNAVKDFMACVDAGGNVYDVYVSLANALLQQRQYHECNEVCDIIRRDFYFDDHTTYRYKYKCLVKLGYYEELTELAQKQLMSSSQHVEYNLDLGHSWLMRGEKQHALKWFEIALSHEPENADVLYYIGDVLFQIGYYERAYNMFCKSITYNPSLYLPYVYRAKYYLHIGATDSARTDLLKASELNHAINYDDEADLLLKQHFGITPN